MHLLTVSCQTIKKEDDQNMFVVVSRNFVKCVSQCSCGNIMWMGKNKNSIIHLNFERLYFTIYTFGSQDEHV